MNEADNLESLDQSEEDEEKIERQYMKNLLRIAKK